MTTLKRLPIESGANVVSFALIRVLLVVAALAALAILGIPYEGLAIALAAGALPWTLAMLALARRRTEAGLNPLVAAGDLLVLGGLEAVEPDIYAPAHFAALFLTAAHAHFQGEQRGLVVGAVAAVVLVPVTLSVDVPIEGGLLHFYEVVFAVCALSTALVVGHLRTAETSARLRARALSRRTIDTESELRRRLSESIHDGPLQELSSVDMMLASAAQSFASGDDEQARAALEEARQLTRRNVTFLRDEIVELGPYAFEELSFEQAVLDCRQTWQRRHGFRVELDVDQRPLPAEVAGGLFRIAQEAVLNAGRHGGASHVRVILRRDEDSARLEVADDGRGFGGTDPLGEAEPGHIGLASMRERAEMLGGRLAIDSGDDGVRVSVNVPL